MALVTGANTGIGQAIALALAEAGADVALRRPLARRRDRRAASRRWAARGLLVEADLASTAPVAARWSTRTVAELGGLDILVNNAGIIRRADAVDFTEADWDAVIDINLKSLFFLCQAAGAAHDRAGPRQDHQHRLDAVLPGRHPRADLHRVEERRRRPHQALANEWAGKGINVNAIAPGYIATNNTAALQADETRNRQILERIPAGRWGDADRPRRRGGLPRLGGVRLRPRPHPRRRRRLAGALMERAFSSQVERPEHPGVLTTRKMRQTKGPGA